MMRFQDRIHSHQSLFAFQSGNGSESSNENASGDEGPEDELGGEGVEKDDCDALCE